jgi:Na+/proline symporter
MTSNDKPSPPWFGAAILGCLTVAAVWILTYTLSPLPGQHALGGWNYAIVGVFLSLFIGLSMRWHGDPLEKGRQEARAAQSARAARAEQGAKNSAAGNAG